MNKLMPVPRESDPTQSDTEEMAAHDARASPEADALRMMARVRLLMIISGLTTLIAIAAVVSVVGYRVFRSGETASTASASRIVMLPRGAHVVTAAVAGDRVVVTLDVGGSTEIRIFDVKTLKETGRIGFATER